MKILEWPSEERPREKLFHHGAQQLSDAELLAILFGSGTKGRSAVDLARDLLNQFDGLRGVMAADYESFCQVPGLGFSKYCLCQAAKEISRRHLSSSFQEKSAIQHPEQLKQFLIASLRHHPQEVFACLFLDNKHRSLAFEKLFYGSINTTNVHTRILIQRCLHHNAAAVVIAHNHPSGIAQPSQADCDLTKHLSKALNMVDIRLLDHMVVGDKEVVSFAEHGLLTRENQHTNKTDN